MIWILGLFSVFLFVYYYLIRPQLYWYFKDVKQGFPIPLLGDNLAFITRQESMFDVVKRLYCTYRDVRYRGFYQTTLPTLMIRDPELLKQIAIKDFDHFLDHRNFTPKSVDPLWNKNLFSLTGQEWRDMRATLSPTFTSSKMRAMFSLMNDSGEQFVKYYLDQNKNKFDLEMKDSFGRFAVDVIANCAFGISNDSLKNPDNVFFNNALEVSNFRTLKQNLKFLLNIMAPKVAEIFKISLFSKELAIFFTGIVKDSIKYREDNHVVRPDMINLLMEARKGRLQYEEDSSNSKGTGFATVEESNVGTTTTSKKVELTDLDMAGQVMIFFFAGFETISIAMCFTAYELAINPDVQDKLRKEIDQHYKETKGKLTYETLSKMKYLDMVITESLRKYPPAIAVDRVCTKPYTIEPVLLNEKPLHLNINETIWIPIVGIHYDPEYYPEPDRFNPERFSDENKHKIKPYTYIPFGLGPRNCIGSRFALMEVKTLFFHLLSKFEIVPNERTKIPMKLSKSSFNPVMEGGFWMDLKKRNDIITI